MPASAVPREQLSDLARPVVDLVERFGFKWTFDHEYPLPNRDVRVQVRDVAHLAPTGRVSQMRAALTRGDKFAPIIVTSDDRLVDGNTRVAAATANKFPTFPAGAVILDVKAEGATEAEARRLHSLGAACNTRHGQGIDRKEIQDAVDHLSGDGNYTATRIAALIGVTDRVVLGILAEKKARARAEALGFHTNGSVNASKLKALGRASDSINDEPFKQLFALVADSGMGTKEISEIVGKVKEAKSDDKALEVLSSEQAARAAQIAEYKASGKSVPPPAAKLRQRLGFIQGYKMNPRDLIEHNQTLAKNHVQAIDEAIGVLQAIKKAQGA